MKNNMVRIYVFTDDNDLPYKLINYNIYYKDLIRDKKYYIVTIDYDDYKRLKRRYNCEIIRYYGLQFYINFIKENKYMLISLIVSFFVLYLLSNTISEIKINTKDENIKKIINNSLNDNDIKMYKKKKKFKEIQRIKDKILSDNEDTLEWLEIREKGCIYIIDITPRVKKETKNEEEYYSDLVASKDGKILFITSTSGTVLKEKNDYVKKGEVLISGNIMKDEKLAYQVKSKGRVYAETWYSVKTKVPFNYTEYVSTGKTINRYYLDIFGHEATLIGKYKTNNSFNNTLLILDKPYLPFKLYKEEMKIFEYKEFHINENEAYKEAIKRSDDKIKDMLDVDEYILSKKVLKKEVFSSKIIIEVFYKVYENIAKESRILKKEE